MGTFHLSPKSFGGLFGGLTLLLRDRRASALFWISLAAIVVVFGYAFAATDPIAHEGSAQVLPFPLFIAAVGLFSSWFTAFAAGKGWLGR